MENMYKPFQKPRQSSFFKDKIENIATFLDKRNEIVHE